MNPLIYHSTSRYNILPLTSRCGVACVFCSHRYNPPGVRAVFFGEPKTEEVLELLDLLDGTRKIVIGESATRLCEGEPLSHPGFAQIIQGLRRRFPKTPVQVTSNGNHLTPELILLLKSAAPLELVISLNSTNPQQRQKLMGPHDAHVALTRIAELAPAGIPWHASLVLMPHLTGWADVEGTIAFAVSQGARSIRLLLPGFSRLAQLDWQALGQIPGQAYSRLKDFRKNVKTAITLEPSGVTDLRAEVAGTLPDSPAANILLTGDIITQINGQAPFSRADAFHKIFVQKNPEISFLRQRTKHQVTLVKEAKAVSGLVMDYDLSPEDLLRAKKMAGDARRVLLLTSQPAAPLWCQAVPPGWQVRAVESQFFGGTISAAGLLTVRDYRAALETCGAKAYERVLLPPVSFDQHGEDLLGEGVESLLDLAPLVWA